MPPAAPESPARGRRPRNRREITLQVATELFYSRGYAQVSMSDIAEATNVGASALYRHFPSKSDLLVGAIRAGIAPYAQALADAVEAAGDPDAVLADALDRLARVAMEHRRLGVLWQRDARGLPNEDLRMLRDELSSITGDLAGLVRAARPELDAAQADALSWCTLGALVSIGFHSLRLPAPQFHDLLVDIATKVTASPIMPTHHLLAQKSPERAPAPAVHDAESRRDELISVATTLFADRGFSATGIDDIGDAVGISGPSVYSHFVNKQAILAAAIQRAGGILRDELDAVLESVDPPAVKLARVVESYVRLANRDRFIIRTLISEMAQLLDEDRELARQDQRRYIDAWVHLLLQLSDVDPTAARIRVQAVFLIVNDAVQTPHLRAQSGFEQTVADLAKNVLGVTGAI